MCGLSLLTGSGVHSLILSWGIRFHYRQKYRPILVVTKHQQYEAGISAQLWACKSKDLILAFSQRFIIHIMNGNMKVITVIIITVNIVLQFLSVFSSHTISNSKSNDHSCKKDIGFEKAASVTFFGQNRVGIWKSVYFCQKSESHVWDIQPKHWRPNA